MKPINTAKISFYSKSLNEGFARTAVSGFVAQLDPTVEQMADIKTAVSEAVTNCIVHAYPEKMGVITLTMSLYQDGKFSICVRDKGCGIEDVSKARQPLFTTGNPDERAGLGFAVMESFMDTLKVTSKQGKGTRVLMTKRLSLKD